jgi:hypothetical protein
MNFVAIRWRRIPTVQVAETRINIPGNGHGRERPAMLENGLEA